MRTYQRSTKYRAYNGERLLADLTLAATDAAI